MDFTTEAHTMHDKLVSWRRDLHMHPELGFQEERTAGLVAAHLTRIGYRVYTGIARTGVIGILQGMRVGPTVMLRFDMDALPIQEENKVEYASQTPGVMHACGHDAHVTIGLGTAMLLQRHRDKWAGTVKLVFQPAEEGMNGAEVMVKEGALDDYGPRPDVVFGLHIWNGLPLGQAGLTAGPMMAAADRWSLTVSGKGGHGALPHQTADTIVATAQIVNAIQTIVSRSVDPQKTAVVTVGTINGGTAFNTIPGKVELTGTVRTFDAEVRALVLSKLEELCQGIATAMGVKATLQVDGLIPALVNDQAATDLMRAATEAILGAGHVYSDFRMMGSEDMAFFLRIVPGAYLFLGSASSERGLDCPHHSSRFDFDEGVLPVAVAVLSETATRFLNQST
jgi:amidohydrolase